MGVTTWMQSLRTWILCMVFDSSRIAYRDQVLWSGCRPSGFGTNRLAAELLGAIVGVTKAYGNVCRWWKSQDWNRIRLFCWSLERMTSIFAMFDGNSGSKHRVEQTWDLIPRGNCRRVNEEEDKKYKLIEWYLYLALIVVLKFIIIFIYYDFKSYFKN